MSKKTFLGVDIGYDQLKVAQVTNGLVQKTAKAQVPENLIREGRISSVDILGGLIRQIMKDNGMKATRAAIVLPDEAVYVKNVDMPMMTEEQLTFNLPFEFHDYITGEVENYVFDYAVVSTETNEGNEAPESEEGSEEALHLMGVGVAREVVEELQTMLRKAGLRMVKSAPALCSYISLIRQQREELEQITDEYGILDLGYHSITMYMYKQDRHIATREFEIGLSQLDDIISDKMGVDRHLAHTYVLSNFSNCLEEEECINFYDNIAVELMRAIKFYEFSNPDSSLSDIWLCGGGAVIEPLIRAFDETLDASLHPAAELLPYGEDIPEANNYVQAVGIALEI